MPYIKNFPQCQPQKLAEAVQAEEGQIISKTLSQNEAVSVTLFAFGKGEGITTDNSTGDAFVQVLSGKGRFTVDGKEREVYEGEAILMPAQKSHSVTADEDFKMLLTMLFPF